MQQRYLMTNEEYQRQAERSRPIDEVRRRQGIEDFNWPERERDARGADAQEKASSKSLVSGEISSPMMGSGADGLTDRRAPQEYEARQNIFDALNSRAVASGYSSGPGTRSRVGGKFVSGALALIVILIALFHFGSKESVSRVSPAISNAPSPTVTPNGPQAKPSPYRSAFEVAKSNSEATPTDAATSVPPPQIVPNVPASTPGQTVESSTPSVSPRSFHAERRGVRNGCANGALTFTASRVDFSCPNDPRKSVSIMRGKVKKIDNDGVQLLTQDKYHFKLPGSTPEEVKRLFSSWFNGPISVDASTSGPVQPSR
jgi:hypothetical protein